VTEYFAHSKPGTPPEGWQPLADHLAQVGILAQRFAEKFGAGRWGMEAGLRHDLGKYSNAFQDYLRSVSTPDPHGADALLKTDHATAGAQFSVERDSTLGHILAYVIAGHHSGLLDGRSDGACQEARLKKAIEPWRPNAVLAPAGPGLEIPGFLKGAFSTQGRDPFAVAFFTRMLFSCLADADFLDTEAFMDPARAASRPTWPAGILRQMEEALAVHIRSLQTDSAPINGERARVHGACIEAAKHAPGLFSLTVPTGGGKTLSSLAFALRHALLHNLDRIVYVIPFTSIIEQNVDVFRNVFAPILEEGLPDPVLEHHCNVDEGDETTTSRLTSQNWDAPLVVTTSVQFYDSLFSNRTSRCRKLHNLARSVIILDEVQTLPVDLLRPCLCALRLLSRDYGATVVLCTATQPAIHRREGFPIGLIGTREIIPEPQTLYSNLSRVRVENLGSQDDQQLVKRILAESQVLCIVNTRSHARTLFRLLGPADAHFHLSALMCPEHRSQVLDRIRERLGDGKPCRLISTQLIEAGVDIDFPVVFRSLSGLDSIAQAAGRCNRNGRLGRKGLTYVFKSEHDLSERFLSDTANAASEVLPLYADPLSLQAIEHYFRLYYWDQSLRWDARHILEEFHMQSDAQLPFAFGFASVAEKFHIIDDHARTVIVPWGTRGASLCEELRHSPFPTSRSLLRALQRFSVQLHTRLWTRHIGSDIELVHSRYPVLVSPELNYDEITGLSMEGADGMAFFG